ncbi:MAG TPA: histidine kinase dimerization/phospho-acceptor domain-containing protein [Candidatus Polarisedimenticolaceae bacterium]
MTTPLPASFVDAFPAGLAVLDRDGRVLQSNARASCAVGDDFFAAFGAEGFFHAARDGYLGGIASGRVDVSFEGRGCHVRVVAFEVAGSRFGLAWLDPMRGEARLLAIAQAWDKALALVAEVRHEIANPLMGLLGQIELLEMRPDLPDTVRAKLTMITGEAQRIQVQAARLKDVKRI